MTFELLSDKQKDIIKQTRCFTIWLLTGQFEWQIQDFNFGRGKTKWDKSLICVFSHLR